MVKSAGKAELGRPPLQSKEDIANMVRAIGETIISRADDIACDPRKVYEIVIRSTIGVDKVIGVEWNVKGYADSPMAGIRSET